MRLSPLVITHTEQVLREILQFAGPADVVISRYFREHAKLGMRERGAIAETVYAILRNRLVYNHLSESGRGAQMRRLVLLGLADIYGVEALGGISEEEKVWLEHVMKIDRARLPKKMQANLPDWLYNRLVAQYGEDETLRLASVLNTPASLDLRVNTLKAKREDVLKVLKEVPVECEPTPYASSGIRLHRKIALQNMPLFREGNVEVQDEGSQLLAQIVGAKRGEMVVDFCAGAGGKTLALGVAMRNTGRLYAFDVSDRRLAKMKPRLARSGLSNVHPVQIAHERDARIKRLAAKADRVLVDSPCSGLGTLRRNPDLKWRQTPETIAEMAQKQQAILESAARLVRPGGRLVYATCSLLDDENEKIVAGFLEKDDRFVLVPMQQVLGEGKIGLEMGDYLKLLPQIHQTDGFFAAVFERVR
ncbi:RsmB/NOP family class I SAM-dependent RNA methyltransferase [Oxalobacter aliiformigenes]|uniref:RsmB/NOP family class I SAM-dependent RNA methyltransferase n=1 Tax=Oxalobacter aliiformigenes TaxID=2946593 RepID=A0A9E9LD46_9BURK|nr:RsmB/NOP family class I SAM-dependent RNA methyltransferase [Oxalobacter aliiformigenes]WAV90732.1 RsmB/NOP family class I SAM-dependent RNA methyltransferase [Oxalobacter aliiformigenes]